MLSGATLVQIVLNGLNLGAIYILVALGFTLIFGVMRIINFAHGEFAMLGGFFLLYFYSDIHIPFLVALPLAAISVAALSLILEQVVYRPFYQKEIQGMIATLGLSIAITYSAVLILGPYQQSIPSAFPTIYRIGDIAMPLDRLVVLACAGISLLGFYTLLTFTRLGLAMRVVAEDMETAQAQGINARATYRVAFFVASGMAALAGGLLAQLYSVSPFMGSMPLLKAFIVVILGGLGSVAGAAVGGLILGMGESVVGTFFGASVAQFASFIGIILILLVAPSGLFGKGRT